MPVIAMNLNMCMSSAMTRSPNSGLIPSDFSAAAGCRTDIGRIHEIIAVTLRNEWRHGMTTSAFELEIPYAVTVTVTRDTLSVELSDGRTIAVPLEWYPRLLHGTPEERNHWRLIGRGHGIHWDKLNEDISIEGLLSEKRSGESQTSLKAWLVSREKR
jgi:hypothetical protein